MLRALDKLGKIGPDAVAEEMVSAAGATLEQARQVVRLSEIAGDNDEILRQAESLVAGSETGQAGVAKLKEVLDGAAAGGVPGRPRPTRSLDRPRTRLLHRHGFRDLFGRPAGHRQRLFGRAIRQPGRTVHRTGIARHRRLAGARPVAGGDGRVGHDRESLDARPRLHPLFRPGPVARLSAAGGRLRAAGIGVEVFPDPKKLGQQLKYADRRGFRVALIAGGNEFQSGVCQVKDLQTGGKQDMPLEPDASSLIAAVKSILRV